MEIDFESTKQQNGENNNHIRLTFIHEMKIEYSFGWNLYEFLKLIHLLARLDHIKTYMSFDNNKESVPLKQTRILTYLKEWINTFNVDLKNNRFLSLYMFDHLPLYV